MAGIATQESICSGHDGFHPRMAAEGAPLFTVNGVAVHCEGMAWTMHDKPDNPPHGGTGIGSCSMDINGAKVCLIGDPVSCGSVIVTGDDTFQIG
ncbi:PAAR domain-containing protein [Aeromonas rivipollensis]|uniref:PAAR domain-containing protein n=1 Tax=Aeromonas rivipollensis TaxID=948519 RepID=UPI0038D1F2BC